MAALIICLLIVCFFIYRKYKKQKKSINDASAKDNSQNNRAEQPGDAKTDQRGVFSGKIKQVEDGWVINPGMPFELTVMNCYQDTAMKVRDLCESTDREAGWKLLDIFASENLKIKEIEDYKKKYAPTYYDTIEKLKRTSAEYQDATPQDKKDMDEEFERMAQFSFYELPQNDIYKLFVPNDVTIDDALLKEYGFDCVNTYLLYYDRIGSVVVIQKESYYRQNFEELVKKGLAIKGKDILVEEILNVQTLKTLNAIAGNPEKQFTRKKQAIEYILERPEKIDTLGEHIVFRELYKLLPLPEKYAHIDLTAINRLWDCHKEEIRLLLNTYNAAKHAYQHTKDLTTLKRLYKGCSVGCTNEFCQCAKDRMQQKYSIDNLPKVPCHIGCSCWLNFED